MTYTAITFAPVQGFIEKSRKLRDLYGSSFILSYLAKSICDLAPPASLISPATINLTRGTPNFILIAADLPKSTAQTAFNDAWAKLLTTSRELIEDRLKDTHRFAWGRSWNQWSSYAWEFFWAQDESLTAACKALGAIKSQRDWTAINWRGESSSLSGADAIAWPEMGIHTEQSKTRSAKATDDLIKAFYKTLSKQFGSIIDETEQLSIPELVKRLVTLDAVATQLNLSSDQYPSIEIPGSFRDLNRFEGSDWTGWFKGDGDRVGKFLQDLSDDARRTFSRDMLSWGETLRTTLPDTPLGTGYRIINEQSNQRQEKAGRIIYAGGDDFLGVLYRLPPDPESESAAGSEPEFELEVASKPTTPPAAVLQPRECLDWFQGFSKIWSQHGYHSSISVSVGFVWAVPGVPQRDVLQHCDLAEKAAKQTGRDRLAIRILFNGGNHLQWICPWHLLNVLNRYRDREGVTGPNANWTHLYTDIATLQARHAFQSDLSVIQALIKVYFPQDPDLLDETNWWNTEISGQRLPQAGILGDRDNYPTERHAIHAVQRWAIALGQVGFHLHETHSRGRTEDGGRRTEEMRTEDRGRRKYNHP